MLKLTKKASSWSLALTLATGIGGVGTTLPAVAEEGIIEEVVVTGSRIKSAATDAPRPVTTYGIEDMKLSGIDSVESVLRNSSYNALGSYQASSGSSFGGLALVNLKGLGVDRTAVLVNGRRIPGNPWTGTSAVDINTIPMGAIDRIEVLTDSASAVYGADAIGGVINIIMKQDWEGIQLDVGGMRADRDDADTNRIALTIGSNSDRASVLVSAEFYKKMPVFDADRDYSNVSVNGSNGPGGLPIDGTTDVQGINGGGNSLFEMDFSGAPGYPGGCDYAGVLPVANPFGVPGVGCGFGYADYSMQNAGIERRATFINAEYDITDDMSVFLENRFVFNKSIGRFAPAIGGFLFSQDSAQNTFGRNLILYHRFVGHGPRDDSGESHETDTTIGLRGSLNLFDNDISYEVYYRDYRMNASDFGKNYVLASEIERLVADDVYNVVNPFDPANAAAIGLSKASTERDINTVWEGFGITLDGQLGFELPGGSIGWAAGWESARENYEDNYDSYREAGNIIGSAGNSSGGGRSRDAFFAEADFPILENLTANLAVRYDDYSDFDSETSPQISVRYQPLEWLTLRASWGEGFKAPNLGDMYSLAAQDFQGINDTTRCRAQGIADGDCPSTQIETFTGGNPELQAEQTESFNFGIILTPIDELELSFDIWNVQLDEVVDSVGEDDLLEMEQLGSLPSGVYINRGPTVNGIPGAITRCEGSGQVFPNCGLVNVNANLASRDVDGWDFRAKYTLDTNIGTFDAKLQYSNVNQYEEELPVIGATDHAGTSEYPENRANFTLRYGIRDVTVSYMYNWIDEHGDASFTFDDWDTHDINIVYTAPFGTQFSFGVQNLTDEDPVIEDSSGWDSTTSRMALELYSVYGRLFTVSARHTW